MFSTYIVSKNQNIKYVFKHLFFADDEEAFIYQILRGYIFNIFMWIYLVLDVIWVLVSVFGELVIFVVLFSN